MADDTEKQPEPGTAVTVAPVRRSEVRVHQSGTAIMDTAGFEHMLRIANVMTDSGVMPESLTHTGKADNKELLPRPVILSRAFMIAEQAAMWRRSPFQLMQAASFVHGKLCWEGKVINAVLIDDYSINCSYAFGTWIPATESVDLTKEGQGDTLGVRVSAMVNGEIQYVDGSVGGWKTTGTNSPWRPGSFKRQLRYRGVREWARAYNPGAVIGIYGDDEQFDEPINVTPPRTGRTLSAGHGEEPQQITGEVIEEQPKADAPKPKAAPAADKAKPTPASATPASTDTQDQKASGQGEPAKQSAAGVPATGFAPTRPGWAPAGQKYHFDGDLMAEDGTRPLYIDGKPAGSATAKDRFSVFKKHPEAPAGEVVQLDDHREGAQEPAGEVEGSAGSGTTGEASEGASASEDAAHDPETGEVMDVEAFNLFTGAVADCETWPKLLATVNAYLETKPSTDEARQARVVAWERVASLESAPVHTADPWMFMLWLTVAEPHRVAPAFSVLVRSDAWAKLSEDDRDRIANAVEEITA